MSEYYIDNTYSTILRNKYYSAGVFQEWPDVLRNFLNTYWELTLVSSSGPSSEPCQTSTMKRFVRRVKD